MRSKYIATIILRHYCNSFVLLSGLASSFEHPVHRSLREEGRLGRFNVRFSEDGDISIAHASRGDLSSFPRKAVRMEATINREMASSSSRIYTPPSAVLSPVALEPLSFFLPSLFRFYVFSTWLQSELDYVHVMGRILVLWWSKTGTRYWALQNLISRFASFYFETDVFTLYLISNQNDFFHFFLSPVKDSIYF